MAITYTDERLLALEPARLENVRTNALRMGSDALAERCAEIQAQRRPVKRPKAPSGASSPVVGFHFTSAAGDNVAPAENGQFWSGVWVVRESLVQPAMDLGGYVALHAAKREPSYRQGRIVGWRVEPRPSGKTAMGISFLLEPLNDLFAWFGAAAGEKGYRRLEDQPQYDPGQFTAA